MTAGRHLQAGGGRARSSGRRGLLALLTLAGLASVACGPVSAASTISDAERDLGEASNLEAVRRAPYEYTKARALLEKAKEFEGHGAFEAASTYARQSRTMSEKAVDVARLAAEREKRDEKFGVRKARPKGDDAPAGGEGQ